MIFLFSCLVCKKCSFWISWLFQWCEKLLFQLLTELDQLLEDAPFPFIMQHASRISNVRKRVLSLNSILRSIQRRVDNIDRVISIGKLPGDWLLSSRASILLSFMASNLMETYWITFIGCQGLFSNVPISLF